MPQMSPLWPVLACENKTMGDFLGNQSSLSLFMCFLCMLSSFFVIICFTYISLFGTWCCSRWGEESKVWSDRIWQNLWVEFLKSAMKEDSWDHFFKPLFSALNWRTRFGEDWFWGLVCDLSRSPRCVRLGSCLFLLGLSFVLRSRARAHLS